MGPRSWVTTCRGTWDINSFTGLGAFVCLYPSQQLQLGLSRVISVRVLSVAQTKPPLPAFFSPSPRPWLPWNEETPLSSAPRPQLVVGGEEEDEGEKA